MKAIETNAIIDMNGNIVLHHPLEFKNLPIRMIILIDDLKVRNERERLFLESFGGWDMNESADDLILSIRESRYFRERDTQL